jgi:Fe-S-cluster containining protein
VTSRRQKVNAELDAIYARLPEIACRGLCSEECTAILMTPAERQRIRLASRISIPDTVMDGPHAPAWTRELRVLAPGYLVGEDYRCPALTAENRCAVYDLRPLICRAYGLTRLMHCHYGCRPTRWLTEEEWKDLYLQVIEAGGLPAVFVQARRADLPT